MTEPRKSGRSSPGRSPNGGPRPGERKSGGRPQHKIPPAVFAQAKRLETENGLPFSVAVQVAKGEVPLKEALASLLLQEKVKKLVDEKALMMRYATPVLRGVCALDKALLLSSVAYRKADEDYRNCHLDAYAGKRTVTGLVLESAKYEVKLQVAEGQEQLIPKHDIKFYFEASVKKAVLKHLEWGAKETRTAPGSLAAIKARVDLPLRSFVQPQSQGKVVSVSNTEGDVFRGRVKWAGKYEVVLELAPGVSVVLLRHSIVSVES